MRNETQKEGECEVEQNRKANNSERRSYSTKMDKSYLLLGAKVRPRRKETGFE